MGVALRHTRSAFAKSILGNLDPCVSKPNLLQSSVHPCARILYFHTIIYCRSLDSQRGRVLLVILLGRKPEVMMQLVAGLKQTAVKFTTGTSIADLKVAFSDELPSAVIMGAGLPLDMRLDVIRFVFEHSETTTVHMKDWSSGSNGMLPFVTGVVQGLLASMDNHID